MTEAFRRSFLCNKSYYFILLVLLHLGCFFFSSKNKKKQRKSHKSFSSSSSSAWSYLKRLFSSNHSPKPYCTKENSESSSSSSRLDSTSTPSITFSSSEQESLVSLVPTETVLGSDNLPRNKSSHSFQDFDFSAGCFSVQTEILPCPTCGEIFHKTTHLENHQYVKHAVSELFDGDSSGKNVVQIIFRNGWINNESGKLNCNPVIFRILKIHNSPKMLARFEETRESVKSKAARNDAVYGSASERCLADGNELLRFHCTTFLCELGRNGNSSLCNKQYCNLCGIIRSGFSAKMDGISTLSTSWRAHEAIPGEIEHEFAFMNVKRAMLVCRVVAGRVGYDEAVLDGGFDSVVTKGGGGASGVRSRADDDEELLVFNPRAVLPCFVIVYGV